MLKRRDARDFGIFSVMFHRVRERLVRVGGGS